MGFFDGRQVCVTGGASFIGSHLVESIVKAGGNVRVVDDLSSGSLRNLQTVFVDVEFIEGDLKDAGFAARACQGQEIVFHLAADHGGRGYVDLHQYACATNLGLDQNVFAAALSSGTEKLVYASSGCAYPSYIQTDPKEVLFLTEDKVGPPYDPDGMYGLAKLAGEMTLQAMHREHGFQSGSCRYFTVYGPRGLENHAVMAMIARAFIGDDPFVVWGTGEQIRNWTYVEDIVSGTMAAAERLTDGTAVNLGTMERVKVMDAVDMVLKHTKHSATIETKPNMPTGPLNRVADNNLAKTLLGWEPANTFSEGLKKTIDWYFATKDRDEVKRTLGVMLTERPTAFVVPR
ncbi:MAG: NAD-dependent epimerase/dehydratase family protein [Actinomycetota bacterium]